MIKLIIFFIILFALYYFNTYTDGWLISAFTSMPKLIALAIAIIAIVFPHDYDKFPDILSKSYYNKNQNINQNKNQNINQNINQNRIKKSKRNITSNIKKYIAANQKWNCNDCGQLLDHSYEIDHKIPLYKGGNNNIHNLQALCRNCHGRKTLIDDIMK